ncbi:MAG: dephospho-CoA kinase [Candidatus Poribacteria bacterium]
MEEWKDSSLCPQKARGLIVGLTGGIACGKTTVAELLAQRGADVIDLDEIGHRLLKKGNPVFERIVKTFGAEILDESGDISRAKLGRIVFHDVERRSCLNQITHPAIIERSLAEAERLAASNPEEIIIIDAPLLIEAGMQDIVDIVVVVIADEKTQLDRLIKRSIKQKSPSVKEAQARIHSQMSLSEKIKHAHFVIENSGGMDELKTKVVRLWDELKKLQKNRLNLKNDEKKT